MDIFNGIPAVDLLLAAAMILFMIGGLIWRWNEINEKKNAAIRRQNNGDGIVWPGDHLVK